VAAALRAARKTASEEGKRAAGLLVAVALERARDLTGARATYKEIVEEAKGTPYATTATFRLRLIEHLQPTPEALENIYQTVAAEPAAEGWFLGSTQWTWTTTRRAAWHALVELRADHLSFRFFAFLRAQSLFPTPYAYLFVLLALGIGIKLLELPFYVKLAAGWRQLRRLRPQIQNIQSAYRDDPQTGWQRLAALYQEAGVNPRAGCAVFVVDLIFVIWALVALSKFSPQMALDGATFWWIADVLQRDFRILALWGMLSLIQGKINPVGQLGQGPQATCGALIGSVIFMGIIWYLQWPAYVIIFWVLLSVLGMFMNLALVVLSAMME
jgi:YidC/Oxa1 family membrane protein insertase